MSWGCDPDTLSDAAAEGRANRSGNPRGSLGWLEAYRAAYVPVGAVEGNEYLATLDRQIEEARRKLATDTPKDG